MRSTNWKKISMVLVLWGFINGPAPINVYAQGRGQTSTLCSFTSGPRAGQTQDYAPQAPLPVGTPCQDGNGSTGTVVAAPSGGNTRGGAGGATSTLCRFTS